MPKIFLVPLTYAAVAALALIPAYVGNEDGLGVIWFFAWTLPTSFVFAVIRPLSDFPEPWSTLYFVMPAVLNTVVLIGLAEVLSRLERRR